MARYKQGKKTRNQIIFSAGKLFYDKGYREAKLEIIAADAGIPTGLINYYFKKQEIIELYYERYVNLIRHSIVPKVLGAYDNVTELHRYMCFNYIFYNNTLKDKNLSRLYTQLITDDVIQDISIQLLGQFCRSALLDSDIVISDSTLRWLMLSDYGAKKVLLNMEMNGDFAGLYQSTQDSDFVSFLSTISLKLAGVDVDMIQDILELIRKLAANIIIPSEMISNYVITTV